MNDRFSRVLATSIPVKCMKLNGSIFFLLVMLSCESFASNVAHYVPGQVLVKYHNDVNRKFKPGFRQSKNALLKAAMPRQQVELWQLTTNQSVENAVKELNTDSHIMVAEPNYRRYPRIQHQPDDELFANQLFLYEQIKLPGAWAETQGNANVLIAVIDDAFEVDHEDLAENIIYPFNALNNGSDPSPAECIDPWTKQLLVEDHGTKVIGVLGAVTNNAKGIAGVAWNTRIMPIKIGCAYDVAAELVAFEQAIQRAVDIINVSYGGPMYSELERMAIDQLKDRNILLVVAAGNTETDNDRVLDYPSSLALPNILSVAASDASTGLTSWSQYGQTFVDLAAPGVGISSLAIGNTYASNLSGTSFSAPIVAGIAALIKSSFIASGKTASFYDLKGAILASVDKLETAAGRLATSGQVNAFAAIQKSKSPEPVLVINSVVIDDLEWGNGNGLLDENERFTLRLGIENTWASMQEPVSVSLNSVAMTAPYPGTIPAMVQGDIFDLQFPNMELVKVATYQKILFELDLNHANRKLTRYFELELGQLKRDQLISQVLNKRLDEQDEFHYYHINLPDNATDLKIEVAAKDSRFGSAVFELLAKHDATPMFDYPSFENGNVEVESDVVIGIAVGQKKILTIPTPAAGTYYITLAASPGFSPQDLQYTIRANYRVQQSSALINPMLLFFLISFVFLHRRLLIRVT